MSQLNFEWLKSKIHQTSFEQKIIGMALLTRDGMLVDEYFLINLDTRKFAAMTATLIEAVSQMAEVLSNKQPHFFKVPFDKYEVLLVLEDSDWIFMTISNRIDELTGENCLQITKIFRNYLLMLDEECN